MPRIKYTAKEMVKKTTAEINAEIDRLKTLEGKLPQLDDYGGNNWTLLKAQIRVLKNRMSMDEIVTRWGVEDDAQGAAEDARFWIDGGDVFSPFDRWGSLKDGIKNPQ